MKMMDIHVQHYFSSTRSICLPNINLEVSLNSDGGMHVAVTDHMIQRNKRGSWTHDDVNPRWDVWICGVSCQQ
jgi:hypothetical protein